MQQLMDWYVETLLDIYDAEQQLMDALPKMHDAASNSELKEYLQQHQQATQRQIERLERLFDSIGAKPNGKVCHGMKGIIQEAEEVLKMKDAQKDVLDAAIIAAVQKGEHYEIASYGTARAYAQLMDDPDAATALQKTLDEEDRFDQDLTRLAMASINRQAEQRR